MPRRAYAAETHVSTADSQAELERTLRRYGATSFERGWSGPYEQVRFQFNGRVIRLRLVMPGRNERRFTHTEARGKERTPIQAEAEWEQACRQKWRAVALVVKAKLEAVTSGIATFEDEFLAYTVLPSGKTVTEEIGKGIALAYETGNVPALLPNF